MRSNLCAFLAVLLSVSAASAPAPVLGATIRPLVGYAGFITLSAISGDGSTVVGTGGFGSGYQAGIAGCDCFLGDLPGGPDYPDSSAADVNFDGSLVVGQGHTDSGYEAFRWTSADGMQGLGGNFSGFSGATGVSFDGSVIVGQGASESGGGAFRWTSAGGMQWLGEWLGNLPGGGGGRANGVSADGSVVVGFDETASGAEAFRWTSADGMQGLGDLPGGIFHSYASAVSGDGATVVGISNTDFDIAPNGVAFRWTSASGMQGLGDLPGGHFYSSIPTGVSFDGSIIVGTGYCGDDCPNPHGRIPFIWDAAHGMRSLQEVLVNNYGLDLTGWMLIEAIDIFADGRTILVADASRPVGYTYWIVTIPEPGSLSLLGLGSFLLLHWRPVQGGRRSDSVNGRSAC